MIYLLNLFFVPIYYILIKVFCPNKCRSGQLFIRIVGLHAILFRILADPYNYYDSENYAYAFDLIKGMSFQEAVLSINPYTEWGQAYVFLNWLLSRIYSSPSILFIFLGIVNVGVVLWFFEKYSYKYLNTVVIYLAYPMLYVMSFFVLRQHFSIALVFIALYYINKPKYFFAFSVLATLFHTSSIIIIPFYFWRRISLRNYLKPRFLIYSIIVLIVIKVGFSQLIGFVSRFDAYSDKETSSNITPLILLGGYMVVSYCGGLFKMNLIEKDKDMVSLISYGFLFGIFSYGLPGGGRLTLLFVYVLPVALSYFYKYYRQRSPLPTLYFLFVVLITIMQLYLGYEPSRYNYVTV